MEYCYRGTDGDYRPIKCKIVEKFGYPNYCINEGGRREKMYENTHYLTEAEAWKSITESINAGVYLLKNDYNLIKDYEKKIKRRLEEVKEFKKEYLKAKNPFNPFMHEINDWY